MLKITNKFKKYYLQKSNILFWNNKPQEILKIAKNNKYIWFPDGKLNLYENCISKNLKKNKIAIITVNSEKKIKKYSYQQLDKKVNRMAEYLVKFSKNKKIRIMIHASASIESAVLMLTCAKLGFHFSVIFEELESLGIQNRIKLFKPNIFFTRLSHEVFKSKMNIKIQNKIKFVYKAKIQEIIDKKTKKKAIKNKFVNSYNSLFTLFTSGSTGAPKGITHSTGGYLMYSKFSCQKQFGMKENSVVFTASDAGWINGHTYSLFGPLSLGSTTILIEKPILLLDINLFKKILNLKTSIIYLPVTIIRLIKSFNKNLKINKKYIRTLGSMGEPLAPSVGKWFANNFLKKNSPIINTYFQTETGGIICSPRYNQQINNVPHGSVGQPLSEHVKLNNLERNNVKEIKILTPWPGMMKNVINGKSEWNKYWDNKNNFRLFDLSTKKEKNIFIHGRNDDVVNIRGHRIGSEEIESTLLKLKKITECCVVTMDDKLEGSKIHLFIVSNVNLDSQIEKIIISTFGTFAIPRKIFYVDQIPKTRSGKILRRLLRNILANPYATDYGDTSTILNLESLKNIQRMLKLNE
jgi:acetyl-CoA synthetase